MAAATSGRSADRPGWERRRGGYAAHAVEEHGVAIVKEDWTAATAAGWADVSHWPRHSPMGAVIHA
jgi:hypothetical protein